MIRQVFLGQAHVLHGDDPGVGQMLDSVNQIEFHVNGELDSIFNGSKPLKTTLKRAV